MHVILCGGRDHGPFTRQQVHWLETFHMTQHLEEVVVGSNRGADLYGRRWAEIHGIETVTFWANWQRYRTAAGPLRNQKMLDYICAASPRCAVLAFAGGAGTTDMCRQARKAGVSVYAYEEEVCV